MNARGRIGPGPWYNAKGVLIASNVADLPGDQLRDRHPVSKMVRTSAGVRVRLLCPTAPIPGAVPVAPDLEDAYLTIVHGSAPRERAGALR